MQSAIPMIEKKTYLLKNDLSSEIAHAMLQDHRRQNVAKNLPSFVKSEEQTLEATDDGIWRVVRPFGKRVGTC